MSKNNLKKLFKPDSICVIGASNKKGKIGNAIFTNIINYGFKGRIYPVNPKYEKIYDYKCYSKITEIEDDVDLAVIVIPARFVVDTVRECGLKNVKNVVVISAGFKEIGREGAKRERELIQICKEYNMRLLGPNCLGVIDTGTPLNASFAGQMPIKGNIAFISQSGALGTSILDWSIGNNIGFSKFISLGNKADIDESDLLSEIGNDPNSKVILFYLEDVKNGEKFIKTVQKTVREKPILVLKSGQSNAGQRAAVSHTGSLAGSNIAYQTAFKQYGVIQVKTISDLFDYAIIFSTQPLPKNDTVCILTNAGGPGIVATDACELNNLKLVSLSKNTVFQLQKNLPSSAAVYNPVDILGDASPERYKKALKIILKDKKIGSILLILTPQVYTKPTETALEIIKLKKEITKPLAAVFMGGSQVEEAKKLLLEENIPVFDFPENAVEALSALNNYAAIKKQPLTKKTIFLPGNK
ncbi:MAG: acetate--CoA ligase alpha subunit, partial [Candidatus Odinarchaeia archaeon]